MNEINNTVRRKPLSGAMTGQGRGSSSVRFVLASAWIMFSIVAIGWLSGGVPAIYQPLFASTLQLVILLAGFWAMGKTLDLQQHPVRSLGLVRRPGFSHEFALGSAVGWGLITALVLPMMLAGSLVVQYWSSGRSFWLVLVNLITLLIASLAEEVAYRGYAFQRLVEAIGPGGATILLSVVFGLMHGNNPYGGRTAIFSAMLAGMILSIAYLRTRALWLPWGLHFAWNASMGIVFGLPVSGYDLSSLIQTRPLPPVWLTGGLYGPEASYLAPFILLAGMIVLYRVTRDLAWKHTFDPIVPGGYAMDAPPPPAHAAMEQAANPASLVQILPTTPQSSEIPGFSRDK